MMRIGGSGEGRMMPRVGMGVHGNARMIIKSEPGGGAGVATVSPGPCCELVGGMVAITGGVLAAGPSGTTVPADEGATTCAGDNGETDIALGASKGDGPGATAAGAAGAVRFENHAEIADQFV